MLLLLLGLIIFLGIHSVRIFAPGFRDAQIAAGGEQRWKGIYTLASFVGLALIICGFSIARLDAPLLYEPPVWMKHINALLMLLSLIAFAASGFPAGKIKAALKHPMLVGVKLWALGHLLANGDLASILLFGSFLVWAVLDRISVKRRGDRGTTVAGPVINDIKAIAAGLVIYALIVWKLHAWLIGVTPL